MATYVFNGSENLLIPNFDPENDTVVIEGFDVADVASFAQSNNVVAVPTSSVTLTLNSGVVLALGGVLFSSLTEDSFAIGSGSDIELGFGDDATLSGNLLVGGAGEQTLDITTDDALAYGQAGEDAIDGGGFENLTIFGGQGADEITNVGAGSTVYGNEGADEIELATDEGETATVFGGQDNDIITGGAGDDVLYGNLGEDTITAGAGNTTIFGGQDDDTITGGAGDDVIFGNLGDDTIITSAGVDSIHGGQGDDFIGGVEADVLGAGELEAGSQVFGGLGEDTINVSVVAGDDTDEDAMTVISGGNGFVGAEDGDDVIAVEVDGDLNVQIQGNLGDDTINLSGAGGTTTVFGGQGADEINTTATGGNNTFSGGLGADTYTFSAAASTATEINIDSITDFNFDEDTIDFGAGDISSVAFVTITNASSLAEIQGFASAAEETASVITVSGGEFAGSYLTASAEDGGFINITGFTGTVDADAFFATPAAGGGVIDPNLS